jgi:hypothetical protein
MPCAPCHNLGWTQPSPCTNVQLFSPSQASAASWTAPGTRCGRGALTLRSGSTRKVGCGVAGWRCRAPLATCYQPTDAQPLLNVESFALLVLQTLCSGLGGCERERPALRGRRQGRHPGEPPCALHLLFWGRRRCRCTLTVHPPRSQCSQLSAVCCPCCIQPPPRSCSAPTSGGPTRRGCASRRPCRWPCTTGGSRVPAVKGRWWVSRLLQRQRLWRVIACQAQDHRGPPKRVASQPCKAPLLEVLFLAWHG